MTLSDLKQTLMRDPVIATFAARSLEVEPERVEHIYRTYARTYVPLGDTTSYVGTMTKWVGGANKGAFAGAVVGDYGYGKSSYLIHFWDECEKRHILAVPPFSWQQGARDIFAGISGWVRYKLASHPPALAAFEEQYEAFRERSLREEAERIAERTEQEVKNVLAALEATTVNLDLSPTRVLDFCAAVTEIVRQAGYTGLLVLLDEPELAAAHISDRKVAEILFEFANTLLNREGNYGIFVAFPARFVATLNSIQGSATARFQTRGCYPNLANLCGPEFPAQLWQRYITDASVVAEGKKMVAEVVLSGVGQTASRSDLAYGPRTVISALKQVVNLYETTSEPYTAARFVAECQSGEVIVQVPTYAERIGQVFNAADVAEVEDDLLRTLAAFPDGIMLDMAEACGLDRDELIALARTSATIRRYGNKITLTPLMRDGAPPQRNELQDAIEEEMSTFAPSPDAFTAACRGFTAHLAPRIFAARSGQQLLGWETLKAWTSDGRTWFEILRGAFAQTEKKFPRRTVMIAVGATTVDTTRLATAGIAAIEGIKEQKDGLDALIHLRLHWHPDSAPSAPRVTLDAGDPAAATPAMITAALNLAGEPITYEPLVEAIPNPDQRTPFGLLYLLREMDGRTLTGEFAGQWSSLRQAIVDRVLLALLGDRILHAAAAEAAGATIPGVATDLLPSLYRTALERRYPRYSTLITQPQWESQIDKYTKMLLNDAVPRNFKRGREIWEPSRDEAARVFGTSKMNFEAAIKNLLTNLLKTVPGKSAGLIRMQCQIHPLEEAIVERINANREAGTQRFDGKDCPWMPALDALALARLEGYIEDEPAEILKIGRTRGSFNGNHIRREMVLYCVPQDPEEMKQTLRGRLDDARAQYDLFMKLTTYRTEFIPDAFAKQIDALTEEEQFDKLSARLDDFSRENRDRLPGWYTQLEDNLRGIQRDLFRHKEQMDASPDAKMLNQTPTGVSEWVSSFTEYLAIPLQRQVQKVQQTRDKAEQDSARAISRYKIDPTKPTEQRAELLVEGQSVERALQQHASDLKQRVRSLDDNFRDYTKWRSLLGISDDLWKSLLTMEREGADAEIAHTLRDELRGLWKQITSDLKTDRLDALPNHAQYRKRFEEIETKRRVYIADQQAKFNAGKERVNILLKSALENAGRCDETFNPADAAGSYDRLYAKAVAECERVLDDEASRVEQARRDVDYAHAILKQIEDEVFGRACQTLEAASANVAAARTEVTVAAIRAASEQPDAALPVVAEAIHAARTSVKEAQETLRASRPQAVELKPDAEALLTVLNERTDLKTVVLQMMMNGAAQSGETDALTRSLDALGELFRKQQVRVTVERVTR